MLVQQVKRPRLTWRDRTLSLLRAGQLSWQKETLLIVRPDAVLLWYRRVASNDRSRGLIQTEETSNELRERPVLSNQRPSPVSKSMQNVH